jgi:predicted alpha/beta-fold hydrolase
MKSVMPTVFWDATRFICIYTLKKGSTITGVYYATLLHRLSEEINKKTSKFEKEKKHLSSK